MAWESAESLPNDINPASSVAVEDVIWTFGSAETYSLDTSQSSPSWQDEGNGQWIGVPNLVSEGSFIYPSDINAPGAAFASNSYNKFDTQGATTTSLSSQPNALSARGVAKYNGYVYVVAGAGDYASPSDKVARYDISADSWESLSPLPETKYNHSVAYQDGYIYSFGGNSTNTAHKYEISSDTWASITSMPSNRTKMGIVSVPGKKAIYLIGGRNGNGVLSSVLEYDVSSDNYSTYNNLNTERRNHGAVRVGDAVYVVGGEDGAGNRLTSVEKEPTLAKAKTQKLASFESGDLSNWAGDTGSFTVDSNGYKGTYNAATTNSGVAITRTDVSVSPGETPFGWWHWPNNYSSFEVTGGCQGSGVWAVPSETGDSNLSGYTVESTYSSSGTVEYDFYRHDDGSKTALTTGVAVADIQKWVEIVVTQWDSNGNITVEARDQSGTVLGSASVKDSTYGAGGIGFRKSSGSTEERFDYYYKQGTGPQPPSAPSDLSATVQ